MTKNSLMGSASFQHQQPLFAAPIRQQRQQQQQEGEQPPAFDYGKAYETLTPENKEVFTRKGWDKGGNNGGPVDVNGLVDNYRHLEKLVGGNNLAPPDMSLDDPFSKWDAGRKALGILDKPEEYKLTRRDMPKGMDGKALPYDEEAEKVFRTAIAGKVPAKYADGVFGALQDMMIARQGAFVQQQAEDKAKTEQWVTANWGANKDTKIARASVMADRIAEQLGIDKADLKTDANSLMGSAGVLRLFDFLADQFGEGFIKDGGRGDPSNENTPVGAKAALERLGGDAAFQRALNDGGDPGHAAAVKRRADLMKIAHGE